MSTTDLWPYNRKRFLLIATATFRRINIWHVQSRSNKNALTAAFSLACLDIRSRNEEAIDSTRNRTYSLSFFTSFFIIVDTFHLFLNWFSTRVSDYRKHVCGSRLYAKIHGPRFQRSYIIARYQRSDLHGTSFQSSPKINRMLITRTICLQWQFTTPDHGSILFFFFPTSSVHLLK